MMLAALLPASVVLVGGTSLVLGCGIAVTALIIGVDLPRHRQHGLAVVERERDIAAALGIPWRTWLVARLGTAAAGLLVGVLTGVWLIAALLLVAAVAGVRFVVGGRAARRQLRMERAFLAQLRVVRERMALAHQSLDTALLEIAAAPGPELEHVLAPLRRGGAIAMNIAECARCSRSPLVEECCAVLLWARTRSLDALIEAIDEVLLPIGEARLAVEEESLVTLTQQRALIFALAALMGVMLASLLRVESFRAYYESPQGVVVLLVALALFCLLTVAVGKIVRVTHWTRWSLETMLAEEAAPNA
ncbi:MAG: hypothetical protein JOY80_10145 [Candidatus Dormibacteraeota bacterium]|nr:hypothetical protein [Candidatus Dormibacteraeota bacterium]